MSRFFEALFRAMAGSEDAAARETPFAEDDGLTLSAEEEAAYWAEETPQNEESEDAEASSPCQ